MLDLRKYHASIFNCVSWALVAIYILYLKYFVVFESYFNLLQDITYQVSPPTFFENLTDILYFFSGDLVLIFIFLLGFVAIHKYFSNMTCIVFQTIFCTISIILLYANQHSWGTVGQYLNFSSGTGHCFEIF